ncbi:MAG TPA: UDP-2,3-diacylglucosamine diphosphatase LpxI [Dissulfurispiraceae bacterium]|nr:UDP-2,3-diacylglucosamine diphosphatase LpxI [Dissulfurispiraceae bacterium]
MQIGIIAGSGELPLVIAEDARTRGYRVVVAALEHLAAPDLEKIADSFCWFNVGKLGSLIEYLQKEGVQETIMAGKVPKSLMFEGKITPDLRAMKLLFTLKDRSDDGILNALTAELLKEGICIIDTATFSPGLLMTEGVITRLRPSKDQWKDIVFGWTIAKGIGSMDIGQTVVVKDKAVMAVEAIEGTDEAILRGCVYANGGAVIVKVSKPQQDMRLDVPAIGMATIETMIRAGAVVLALEAGRSIIIQKQDVVSRSDQAGIIIVGVSPAVIEGIRH